MCVLSRMRRRGREESEKDKQSPLGRACDGQRAQTMRVKGATSLATFLAGRSSFFEDFVPLPWTHGKFFSPSEEADQTVMSITTFGKKASWTRVSSFYPLTAIHRCANALHNCSFRSTGSSPPAPSPSLACSPHRGAHPLRNKTIFCAHGFD